MGIYPSVVLKHLVLPYLCLGLLHDRHDLCLRPYRDVLRDHRVLDTLLVGLVVDL